ncbi:phosphoribosyltransferase [Halorubrum sp. DTA46]|uniref:phosphoribosyltransferase n=1 Tax=Halorubrum sp. DTA46 TaxID=3402162 RepID=UPI003AAF4AB3
MNYKSIADLSVDTRRFAQSVPDVDLVVGIPRSGLLAASLLCLHLNIPMTDVDRLCEGRLIDSGERHAEDRSFGDLDSVLVVDDSVNSGSQMTETQKRLEKHDFPFDLSYGAMYVSSQGRKHVDHWAEFVPTPRVFEWNVIHHPALNNACVDIDGVLCRDPTKTENDDGERYREFLSTVEPTVVPDERIGHLVTNRLEKYRPETEDWLDKHEIRYDNLVMMDLPSKEIRQERGNHAQHKADVYDSTDALLFIESEPRQAEEISRRTARPVLCYETMEMFQPGRTKRTQRAAGRFASRFRKNPASSTVAAAKHVYSRFYYLVSKAL